MNANANAWDNLWDWNNEWNMPSYTKDKSAKSSQTSLVKLTKLDHTVTKL